MFLQIDPSDGVAIYEQVVRQMKYAVANGALRPGEMVPSVRELARELAINPNTVTRAYRDLQADAVLRTVRGTGLVVAEEAVGRCRRERGELIRGRLREVLAEARRGRIDPDELRKLLEEELRTPGTDEEGA